MKNSQLDASSKEEAVIHFYLYHNLAPMQIAEIMEMKFSKVKQILKLTRQKKPRELIHLIQSSDRPCEDSQHATGVSATIALALATGEWK